MVKKKEKAVLVTGAARRIGRAIAIACAGEGFGVIAHYSKSRDEVASLGKEIREIGVSFSAIKHDLSTSPANFIRQCLKLNENLNGIINNASIFEKCALMDDSLKSRRLLQINTFSPLAIMRDFASICKKGFIINLLDANIDRPHRDFQVYRLSKRILREVTFEMAYSLAPTIRVNGIAPGAVLPSKFSGNSNAIPPSAPMVNGGRIEDVTNAVKYLVNNENITGQILYADGGMHLNGHHNNS
jgi:NAD(P)-dependent dehydrogenase (short-subunit alcohol dehydrogenase family)